MVKGRRFWKMTGSGNDFVFVDGRDGTAGEFEREDVIRRVCARGTGVGADGLVILTAPDREGADIGLRYFNSDGSIASLCGNATLCTAALGARLGAVNPSGFGIETGTGVLRARITDALPEFDLPPISETRRSLREIPAEGVEQKLGFAVAGIPHIVVLVLDVEQVEVVRRGRQLRHDASLEDGANVNFVSRTGPGGSWRIRTYERGVEDETLACGTGTVAAAVLLRLWDEAGSDTELETASGRVLGVRSALGSDGVWRASLRGEGRLVFEGVLADV
jgi:diaminopimelate epimerase